MGEQVSNPRWLVRVQSEAVTEETPMPLPRWTHRLIPECSHEKCSHYDGKRCGITGSRPAVICEPVVASMAELMNKVFR